MIELYNEDCMNLIKRIPDKSIDLIITDPPYGVGFSKGFDDSCEYVEDNINKWLCEMYRVLKDNTHCYIFIPVKEIDLWVSKVKEIFNFKNILATKTYTQNLYLKDNFSFNFQPIIFCSKGNRLLNQVDFVPASDSWRKDKRNKNPKDFTYQYPSFLNMFSNTKSTSNNSIKQGRHPCEKCSEFIKNLVELSSNESDIVLDMFMGTGSTGIACQETNRQFIGCELNTEYYNKAKEILGGIRQ